MKVGDLVSYKTLFRKRTYHIVTHTNGNWIKIDGNKKRNHLKKDFEVVNESRGSS